MSIERPPSVPEEGLVPRFDAGWNAHEVGLERETVVVLAGPHGWPVLGWDCREHLVRERETRELEGEPHA